MIDAVLDFHMSPHGCGVSKFNYALAQRLGVPIGRVKKQHRYRRPLFSIKCSEWPDWWKAIGDDYNSYELFFHDSPSDIATWPQSHLHPWAPRDVLVDAWRVFAANEEIAEKLRHMRPDIVTAFCPSTLGGTPERGAYRVLVFGMAHKLLLPHFEELKRTLDALHPDYTIELSTAIHAGQDWGPALEQAEQAMRGIFGDRLRVLGFLSDDALAAVMREVDAVAAYYTPALRANNTTYWAAVDAGKKVYTNRDEHSPQEGDPPASWDRLVALIQGAA